MQMELQTPLRSVCNLLGSDQGIYLLNLKIVDDRFFLFKKNFKGMTSIYIHTLKIFLSSFRGESLNET